MKHKSTCVCFIWNFNQGQNDAVRFHGCAKCGRLAGDVRHCENSGKIQSCPNAADEPALPESDPLHTAESAAEWCRFRWRQKADESGFVEVQRYRDHLPGTRTK